MTSQTKDGFVITSIERDGEWDGHKIGRVWIFDDEGNYDAWKVASIEMADALVYNASSLTRDEWIDALDAYQQGKVLTWMGAAFPPLKEKGETR